MKEQLEAVRGLLRSAWRFRWTGLAMAAIVGAVGTFCVLAAPELYPSQAQIYVDSGSVLRPLLQGLAITDTSRQDSDVVRGALLARPTLDRVARLTGLYARAQVPAASDRLLSDLAMHITIHGDSSTGLYTIAYEDPDPHMAQSVVKTLLANFVDGSIGAGRTDRRNAENFLQQQVAEYEQRLSESEARLADFKKRNLGLMPDQRGDYFARLQSEMALQDKLRTDLAIANHQRDEFVRKIGGGAPGQKVGAEPSLQDVQAAQALDARLREARTTLEKLLEKFTDDHPSVVAQRETIQRLEALRQAGSAVAPTNPTPTPASAMAVDPVVQSLQITLANTDAQIAALTAQIRQSEARIAEFQHMVTVGPEVEAELARLNRNYGVTKAQYEALLQRLESARISNDAERSDQLRFRVLEPPRVALRPAKPNRPLLLSGVLFGAIALGVGIALLRAQIRPVFFSKRAVSSAVGLHVIGTVTRAFWPHERWERAREYLAYAVALTMLIVCIMTAAALSFPLSQWLRHTVRLGVG